MLDKPLGFRHKLELPHSVWTVIVLILISAILSGDTHAQSGSLSESLVDISKNTLLSEVNVNQVYRVQELMTPNTQIGRHLIQIHEFLEHNLADTSDSFFNARIQFVDDSRVEAECQGGRACVVKDHSGSSLIVIPISDLAELLIAHEATHTGNQDLHHDFVTRTINGYTFTVYARGPQVGVAEVETPDGFKFQLQLNELEEFSAIMWQNAFTLAHGGERFQSYNWPDINKDGKLEDSERILLTSAAYWGVLLNGSENWGNPGLLNNGQLPNFNRLLKTSPYEAAEMIGAQINPYYLSMVKNVKRQNYGFAGGSPMEAIGISIDGLTHDVTQQAINSGLVSPGASIEDVYFAAQESGNREIIRMLDTLCGLIFMSEQSASIQTYGLIMGLPSVESQFYYVGENPGGGNYLGAQSTPPGTDYNPPTGDIVADPTRSPMTITTTGFAFVNTPPDQSFVAEFLLDSDDPIPESSQAEYLNKLINLILSHAGTDLQNQSTVNQLASKIDPNQMGTIDELLSQLFSLQAEVTDTTQTELATVAEQALADGSTFRLNSDGSISIDGISIPGRSVQLQMHIQVPAQTLRQIVVDSIKARAAEASGFGLSLGGRRSYLNGEYRQLVEYVGDLPDSEFAYLVGWALRESPLTPLDYQNWEQIFTDSTISLYPNLPTLPRALSLLELELQTES